MLRNYLKIAIRTIIQQKGYSFINIAGLTLGLSITLVIAFYVIDDLTFDRQHDDADKIFRVLTLENTGQGSMTYSITAGPLIPAALENIPEVISATRVFGRGRRPVAAGSVPLDQLNQDNSVRLRGIIAEPEFFNVFSFKILYNLP